MQTAYTDAAGRTNPDHLNLGSGNIGGQTLAPGLYTWGTGVTIPADVTIAGEKHRVARDGMIIMPANKPHSLAAVERFKMVLVMIRSE